MTDKNKFSPCVIKAAAQIANLSPIHFSGPRDNLVRRIEKIIYKTTNLLIKEESLEALIKFMLKNCNLSDPCNGSELTQLLKKVDAAWSVK